MAGISAQYIHEITRMELEIKEIETKAQKAMRITLWLKILMAIATISAVGAWLNHHESKELWAVIILGAKIADTLFDVLPYTNQKAELPRMKYKLMDILLEMKVNLDMLERGEISERDAALTYYDLLNTWSKALG